MTTPRQAFLVRVLQFALHTERRHAAFVFGWLQKRGRDRWEREHANKQSSERAHSVPRPDSLVNTSAVNPKATSQSGKRLITREEKLHFMKYSSYLRSYNIQFNINAAHNLLE